MEQEKEQETVDPIYMKGFEHGYWLRRGDSKELDNVINGSKNHVGYQSGLIAGKKEAEREKTKERLNSQFDKSKNQDKNIDIE